MASKRAKRRKGGKGKRAFVDQTDAVSDLISLKRKGETNIHTYKCRFCKCWHVGHIPARIRQFMASRERQV